MKKKILVLLCITLTLNYVNSQTRAEKKALKKEQLEENYKATKQLIESGKYEFVAASLVVVCR